MACLETGVVVTNLLCAGCPRFPIRAGERLYKVVSALVPHMISKPKNSLARYGKSFFVYQLSHGDRASFCPGCVGMTRHTMLAVSISLVVFFPPHVIAKGDGEIGKRLGLA